MPDPSPSLSRLSLEQMDVFRWIVNENYLSIQSFLINQYQHQAYFISEDWVAKYYSKHQFYLLCLLNNPIGVVSLKKIVDFAYIEYFFIAPSYHHQGYGQLMLNLLIPKIKHLGLSKIRLFVHKESRVAQSAYQKYGFCLLLKEKQAIRNFENARLAPHFLVNHWLYEKILS